MDHHHIMPVLYLSALFLLAPAVSSYYEYPTKVLYLRDLGTKYTGEEVSLTAEVLTYAGEECRDCRVWFYVESPYWEGDNWVGYTPYSSISKSGLYTLKWKIVPGMPEGTYTYYAQVKDMDGNAMSDLSPGYSFKIIKETMRARILGLWPVDDSPAGADINLLAHVENTGDAALDCNCRVIFHVSAETAEGTQTYDAGYRPCTIDDFSGNQDVLPVGAGRWYKQPWHLPFLSGKYTYYATVEYKDREINEIPPTYSFKVFEPRKASIASILPVRDAHTGSAVVLGATVENTADIVLADGCRIEYYVKGPAKGGLSLEGPAGYSDCAEKTGRLAPLYYKEKRNYSIRWTPPLTGNYSYKAVVKYLGQEISPWSTEEGFRAGDDITATATTPQHITGNTSMGPDTQPPEKESKNITIPKALQEQLPPQEPTPALSTLAAPAAPIKSIKNREENNSTTNSQPKVVGDATLINPGNPLISMISITAALSASLYMAYRGSMHLKGS